MRYVKITRLYKLDIGFQTINYNEREIDIIDDSTHKMRVYRISSIRGLLRQTEPQLNDCCTHLFYYSLCVSIFHGQECRRRKLEGARTYFAAPKKNSRV